MPDTTPFIPCTPSRRGFLAAVAGSGLGLAAGSLAAEAAPAPVAPLPPAEALGQPVPYWTGEREMTLCWPVSNLAKGWIAYGPTEALGSIARADDFGFNITGSRVLKVRLRNLTPGATVHYRVHTQPLTAKAPAAAGPLRRFTLPAAGATQAHLAVWNDTHDHHDTIKALQVLTGREPTDALLWNGDISNNIEREQQIVPLYLAPAGGVDVGADRPLLFVRGNHDVRGASAPLLGDYTGHRRPYYSFRLGPVAGIVLDTGEDKPDDHPSFGGRAAFEPFLREQAAWLAEEIAKPGMADAPFRVVFCHIPLRWREEVAPNYAEGGYDHVSLRGRELWHASLVKWQAQLVVSGHTHEQHFLPADAKFPYAQLVGGGPQAGNARLLRLDAAGNTLRVRALDLGGKSTFEKAWARV